MLLYIIRHAWAEDRDDSRWPNDDMRPLTADGKERFAQVVKKLVRSGVAPGAIAASPLTRCVETAEILAAGLPRPPKVVERDGLRPGSDLQGLLQWTAQQCDRHDQIAWVGHAPDVGRLTAALIASSDVEIRFAKGAVASIHFDAPPAPAAGELQWLVTAKVLGV